VPANDKVDSFVVVFGKEIEALKLRRQQQHPEAPWVPDHRAAEGPPDERALRREVLGNDVVGLALSGGGIRSATFNLGVLQGLAELGLLRRFDYLSTVSGGGYIGGWLAAWIKREGSVENVEKQLHPSHVDQAEAVRWKGTAEVRANGRVIGYKGPVLEDEPEAIRHLRTYSSYLAPRLGLLSADGWVLLAIYLRNLLLNQLVLLLGVLAVLFGVASVVQAFAVAEHVDEIPLLLWAVLGLVAVAALCRACFRVYWSLVRLREAAQGKTCPNAESIRTTMHRLHTRILIPLLVAAVAASLLALHLLAGRPTDREPALALAFAGAFAVFHGLFDYRSWKRWLWDRERVDPRWLLSGVTAGGFGGLCLYLLLVGFHAATVGSPARTALAATVLPPLLLGVFVFTSFVQLGVLGRLPDEANREWWSSLGGWILLYAAGWLALFGTALFGTYLALKTQDSHWLASATAVLTWASSVAGGLWAAHSANTGSPQAVQPEPAWTTRLKEILARLAPGLFLLGLFVLVSLLATRLIERQWPTGDQFLETLDTPDGRWAAGQEHAWLWTSAVYPAVAVGFLILALLLSLCVDVNVFSLQGMYANRLVRCYLGASRRKKPGEASERPPGAALNSHGPARDPNAITGLDPQDDMALCKLQTEAPKPLAPPVPPEDDNQERAYGGPLPLICATLNLVQGDELAWQERKAESFLLSPRFCGSPTTGYRPTETYAGGLSLGTAMAISGAALSPNMGYHSEPAITALLTVFNVRLGAWLGNPRQETWTRFSPTVGLWTLLYEALGRTNAHSKYVYLSDGGHFENLGVYELIRRRCRFILLCDAGADPDFGLADLGNLVRKVRIDLGLRIDIKVQALRPQGPNRQASHHVAVGKICYGDVDRPAGTPAPPGDDGSFDPAHDEGILVYIKPALTGDESPDLENYKNLHRDFPHETTLDQFFTESQFESYRALGYHSVHAAFKGRSPPTSRELFTALYQDWSAAPADAACHALEANLGTLGIPRPDSVSDLVRENST
jgi:uncharacterized membrane protein HdeD (DUF308 family)